ncbi:cytochrome p450 monooxygenase [Seiridium cupressi]
MTEFNGMHSNIPTLPMVSALALGVIVVGLYVVYQWALPKPIPGIPYDSHAAKNLRGSLPDLLAYRKINGRLRPWFVEQALKHQSPLVQAWMLPLSKPVLILADYQEAQDLLLRRGKEFDRGRRGADVFHGVVPNHHISMTSSDSRFKANKELVRDLMAPTFLNEVSAPEIYSKTMMLVNLWTLKAKSANGKPFDARKDIVDAAMDIINAAAFSFDDSMSTTKHQLDYLAGNGASQIVTGDGGSIEFPRLPDIPDIAAISAIADHLGTQFRSIMPRLDHKIRLLTQPDLRRNITRKDAMISREIARSLARFENGDHTMFSALDHLLQREMNASQKAGRQPDFTSPSIKDEIFGYIVAGHETSSTSLQWTMKHIANHPEVQSKLRSALREAYSAASRDPRQPTVLEITKTNVPYLDAVLEESLRCDAPLPIFAREATQDTVLLGYKIPKGTTMFMAIAGPSFKSPAFPIDERSRSGTSQEKYRGGQWKAEDMHLFKPERWLKTDERGNAVFDSQSGPMLAFGMGPRGCFGKRLAYLEMRVVLALLVWNFEFKQLAEPFSSHQPCDSITTMPKYCYVALERLNELSNG